MNVITISRRKFKELDRIVLSRNVTNTEARILDFNYKQQSKVLKALYYLQGAIFANKLYTIEMLDSNKSYLPTSFLIPDYLCAVNNQVIGFTIPKFDGENLSDVLLDEKVSYSEKIYYLKKIGEILNQLQNIRTYTPLDGVYINDLHESNFLVDLNKKELKVIDLDSCKIGHNKVFASKYMGEKSVLHYSKKYKTIESEPYMGCVKPDSNSEIYCYIMLILNYLLGENLSNFDIAEYYEYLNYLESIGINRKLINTFGKIIANCDNENPMQYLETLTIENIVRANKKVYYKVKNRV